MTTSSGVRAGKTGGWGGRWVELERPKPPRVGNVEDFWNERPAVLSARGTYWVRQIVNGWRPPRRIALEGYHGAAEWYGIYLWEYLNLVFPLVWALERSQWVAATGGGCPWPAETGLGWTRVEAGEHANLVCRWTAVGDWKWPKCVDELAFGEKPGVDLWRFRMPGHPPAVASGNQLEVSVPLEEMLARMRSRWLPFGTSLAEAVGGAARMPRRAGYPEVD